MVRGTTGYNLSGLQAPNSSRSSRSKQLLKLYIMPADYYAAARISGAPVPPPGLIGRAVAIQASY